MTWFQTDETLASGWDGFWTWFGDWFVPFAQSPGFAWSLVVVALAIVGSAALKNAQRERWWRRAQHAMALAISANESERRVGSAMLSLLRTRDKREAAFISVARDWASKPRSRSRNWDQQ